MISQSLKQQQHLRISPQQVQLLNLFQLTSMELEQRIQTELESNPLLEEKADPDEIKNEEEPVKEYADLDEYIHDDIPDYKLEYANYFSKDTIPERPIADEVDYRQQLKDQLKLQLKDDEQFTIAAYLVDSLNEQGMLDLGSSEIAENISFQQNKWIERDSVEKVLSTLQQLDPPGIGARNIRECFLLQLARQDQEDRTVQLAIIILREFYSLLLKKDFEAIRSGLNLGSREFENTMAHIARLEFKPVQIANNSDRIRNSVVPDFILTIEDGELKVGLLKQRSDKCFINHAWMESIQKQLPNKDRSCNQYLKNKLQSAEWFINALKQRENTMIQVMQTIAHWQRDFFLSGDRLRITPMILKDIADTIGNDIATVSRITSNKYVSAPFGIVLLKSLFSKGMIDLNGDKVNCEVIQKTLKEEVEKEDKNYPLTDYQLVCKLAQRGFKLARRTVAKYRELLRIPAAQLRST